MQNKKLVAAQLGGAMRIKVHGNPGTTNGRRLGGLRSLETHRKNNTGFKTLQVIKFPKYSAKLAECLGIFMGDGHLSLYQASVVTNSETDQLHALYIKNLLEELFGLKVSLTKRSDCNAVIILVSSKKVSDFLFNLGMPMGNKTQGIGMIIQDWIKDSRNFRFSFLRGLIDTDGCIYQDKHIIKNKTYSSTCIAFTNTSKTLLDFVEDTWKYMGLNPTRTIRDVRLRRKKEVAKYAEQVGFSNPKHALRIKL
jgi:intein/homing endonuclease